MFVRMHKYYVINSPTTYWGAHDICRDRYRNGNLATFQDEIEWNAVKAWLDSSSPGMEVWLGYTDQDTEGFWHSVDDDSGMPDFLWPGVWISGEPNNWGGNENCGMFRVAVDGSDVQGNDADCNANYNFVCREAGAHRIVPSDVKIC